MAGETVINWNDLLKGGLTSAIDGHFQKEAAKHQKPIEQIKPAVPSPTTTGAAVTGALKQNNIVVGGVTVNKTLLVGSTLLLGVALAVKMFK